MIRNVSLVNGQTDRLALPYIWISRPFSFLLHNPLYPKEQNAPVNCKL
jgi:hypothetical protein